MEGVHHTTQAGLQVAAAASTQAFQLVAAAASTQAFQLVAADTILDFLEEASQPFLEASQILPQCTGHVVHQVVEDVGPAVEVEDALPADVVQVHPTLHHSLCMEDVDLAVLLLLMEL